LTNVTNGLDTKITTVDTKDNNMLVVLLDTPVGALQDVAQSFQRRDVELAFHFLQMAGKFSLQEAVHPPSQGQHLMCSCHPHPAESPQMTELFVCHPYKSTG
jgi:hypothetical protein